MEDNTIGRQKSVVQQLNFGQKTAKRVAWEDWSFTVVGPLQVEVTNESYGYLKNEHSYIVTIEEQDELIVPRECECPADRFQEDYDCKHKVALATVGNSIVLEAARDFPTTNGESRDKPPETLADRLATDGGMATESPGTSDTESDACPNGDTTCPGPNADSDTLPCFACYADEEAA